MLHFWDGKGRIKTGLHIISSERGTVLVKKKLGILLSTPPAHGNLHTAVGLIEAALQKDLRVYLYLVDEGVKNMETAEIRRLSKKGLRLFLCAYGAQRYGVPVNDGAVFGGLVVLSDLVKGCDRFVTLN